MSEIRMTTFFMTLFFLFAGYLLQMLIDAIDPVWAWGAYMLSYLWYMVYLFIAVFIVRWIAIEISENAHQAKMVEKERDERIERRRLLRTLKEKESVRDAAKRKYNKSIDEAIEENRQRHANNE